MAPLHAHTRANLDDINLEDIDFEQVKNCTDKDVIKRYIKMLEEDGSFFHELQQACKDKLLEVCPKDYYILYPRQASVKEVDDVTRDLLDWQESVKETDAALRATRKQNIFDDMPGTGVTAPIRGQEEQKHARPNVHRKEEIKDQAGKKTKENDDYARDKTKMRDYYNKWDQVDVDAMEQEMDREEAEAAEARKKHFDDMRDDQNKVHDSLKSSAVKAKNLPENVPEAHRRHMSDSEKEKGNEAFYAKDFEEAEAYYSRSLHYRADDPSCWANRALARMKLGNPSGALEDCEHALAINDRYMKALHRRGKALYDLGRYEEAVQSFQLALIESPGNTQINGDLMIARRKLRSGDTSTPSQPKTFAPPARSVAAARGESSCVIEEVFDDEDDAKGVAATPVAPGYTRVQIEDDSEEDEEDDPSVTKAGFHKVQIQEDSEDSEEGEPETEPSAPGHEREGASAAPKVAAGFHKIQIVDDDSDSEEEECTTKVSATVQSKASAPEVCTATEEFAFGDMD